MFSWFRASCPVEFKHKVWIEYRLRHLALRLGIKRINVGDVLIPTPDAIPELAPGKTPDIEALTRRLCDRLQLDRDGLSIEVVDRLPLDSAAGIYRSDTREILLQSTLLADPARLLSTLIHELLHDLLLSGGVLTGDEADHEQMTDLAACLVGCGLPLANATVRFDSGHSGAMSWWQMSRLGYLSSPEFGYAMALCCWIKEVDAVPSWGQYLRLDAREPLRKGLKFLNRTGDSLFRRGPNGDVYSPTMVENSKCLIGGSDTELLGVLWSLSGPVSPIELSHVCELVRHRKPAIRIAACNILAAQPCGESARDRLLYASEDEDAECRAAGTRAFVRNSPHDLDLVRVIKRTLHDSDSRVVSAAIFALTVTDLWNEEIESHVWSVLTKSLSQVRNVNLEEFMSVLMMKTDGVEQKLRDQLPGVSNIQELSSALEALKAVRSRNPQRPQDWSSHTTCPVPSRQSDVTPSDPALRLKGGGSDPVAALKAGGF